MWQAVGVFPLILVTEPRVDQARQGKLEEDSRSRGDCRRVYSLRASAAGSLQRLLINYDRQKRPTAKEACRPSATKVSIIVVYRT